MIVLVGSTRPAKVDGTRDAIAAIARVDARFAGVRVETIDVAAVAPAMPMTAEATRAGARARAEALLARRGSRAAEGPAIAIGVEGGVDPLDGGGLALVTWAAASDGTAWGFGAGGSLVLPEAIAREIAAGHELGDVMDRLAGEAVRGTRGAWGVLTRDLVGRRDAFRLAVLAALAPFYNPALYGHTPWM